MVVVLISNFNILFLKKKKNYGLCVSFLVLVEVHFLRTKKKKKKKKKRKIRRETISSLED
jgi:hypothetical protein